MDRRDFIRLVGGGVVLAATTSATACAPTGAIPRAACCIKRHDVRARRNNDLRVMISRRNVDGKVRAETLENADHRHRHNRPDCGNIILTVSSNANSTALDSSTRHGRHEQGPVQGIVVPGLAGHDKSALWDVEAHFRAPDVRPAMNCFDKSM